MFDRCLYTPLAAATGARGNSTALVGTPETVAEALADYVDAGASALLIRGYEPLRDAEEYGRELIPRVRAIVAARAAAAHLTPERDLVDQRNVMPGYPASAASVIFLRNLGVPPL